MKLDFRSYLKLLHMGAILVGWENSTLIQFTTSNWDEHWSTSNRLDRFKYLCFVLRSLLVYVSSSIRLNGCHFWWLVKPAEKEGVIQRNLLTILIEAPEFRKQELHLKKFEWSSFVRRPSFVCPSVAWLRRLLNSRLIGTEHL